MKSNTTKHSNFQILFVGLELFVLILFLLLPLFRIVILGDFEDTIRRFSLAKIISGQELSKVHQAFAILFIIFTGGLIFVQTSSIFIQKSFNLISKILLFLQLFCSFFFIIHLSVVGLLFELALVGLMFLLFYIIKLSFRTPKELFLFSNVVSVLILILLMAVILAMDTYLF